MANYIENKEMYQALKEYLEQCNQAEQQGLPQPVIPRYIGEAFIQIANGLARNRRFSKIPNSNLSDMISEAIASCVVKIRNFDYNKYQNPFAYFTQICWFSFMGDLTEEYRRDKAIYESCVQMNADNSGVDPDYDKHSHTVETFIGNFEQRELERKKSFDKDKKFVHRILTKKPAKPKPVPTPPNFELKLWD